MRSDQVSLALTLIGEKAGMGPARASRANSAPTTSFVWEFFVERSASVGSACGFLVDKSAHESLSRWSMCTLSKGLMYPCGVGWVLKVCRGGLKLGCASARPNYKPRITGSDADQTSTSLQSYGMPCTMPVPNRSKQLDNTHC